MYLFKKKPRNFDTITGAPPPSLSPPLPIALFRLEPEFIDRQTLQRGPPSVRGLAPPSKPGIGWLQWPVQAPPTHQLGPVFTFSLETSRTVCSRASRKQKSV